MFYAVIFVNLKVITLMDFYIATNFITITNMAFSLGWCQSTYYFKNLFKEVIMMPLRDIQLIAPKKEIL